MDGRETITVKYSCRLCGIRRREVEIEARCERENVVEWLEGPCVSAIARDHATISPECTATEISELMIPVSGADKIGGVIRQ